MKKTALFLILLTSYIFAQDLNDAESEYAGEFYGMPVTKENYYFAARVVFTFNTPWGGIPNNTEEFERRVWDDLLLSYEAFRRGIAPSTREIEEEISGTIKEGNGPQDWKEDKKAYTKWVKKKLGGPRKLFEHQIMHLVQLKKLRQQVMGGIDPIVTEEEAYQEFLNEYNTLSVELAQFDKTEDAEGFYNKAKADPNFWEEEKKNSIFRRPGFVSLEFLMDLWKFPKDSVYKMIEMEAGSFYPPARIYKGYGVFKILETRKADKAEFPKQKEFYYNQIREKKKYDGFYKWLADLREDAGIKIFIKPPEGLFQEPSG